MKTRPVATVILVLLLAGAVVAWVGAGRFWPNHSLRDVIDAPRTGDQASVPGAPGMALGLPPVREPEGGKAGPVEGSGAPQQVAGASTAPTAERPAVGLPLPVPGPAKPDVAAPSSTPGAPSGTASGGVADRPAESGGLVAGQAGGTLPSSAPAQGAPAQGGGAQGGASQGGASQGGATQGGGATGGPRFDVVRVGPQGTAIIAGRAAPGSDVVVKDGDTEVARARADAQGAFVALPSEPLRPGGRELTLASRSAGGVETKGDGSVVMVVPPPPPAGPAPAPAGAAQAILVPDSASPRVLQGPGPDAGQGGAQSPAGAGRLSVAVALDRVDYDEKGAIRFTGGAAPGAAVRLYVDNVAVGDTRAGDDGRWSLTPAGVVTPGVHSLRVDAVDGRGVVTSRVELPFQRDTQRPAAVAGAGEQAVPQVGGQVGVQVVVQPGQSLWRLARVAYGRGVQYSVIYLANRDQIRDPRLIYPGQTFSVPPERP